MLFIFTLWASLAAHANEVELQAIARLAAQIKPLPPHPSRPLGVLYSVGSRLDELIEPVLRLSGPRGEAFDVYGQFLSIPVSMSRALESHVRLSNAVVDDLALLGDRVSAYRLPTYVDPGGLPLPEAMQLRVDAARMLDQGFYLFRTNLRQLRSYLTVPLRDPGRGHVIAPRGLNGLVKHSAHAQGFLANVVGQYEKALRAYTEDTARFVDRVVNIRADVSDVPMLRAEMEALSARMDHMYHSSDFLVRTIVEILPIMAETSTKPLANPAELGPRVDALGRGLAASLRRTRELLPKVSENHTLMTAYDPIKVEGEEVLLARIEHDLHWLYSGGGWHISNLSLPRSMMGPDGLGGITFYQSTLIFRYVLVMATEVNRLGKAPIVRRLLSQVGLGPKRANLPVTRATELEAELWATFFRAAGLDEKVMCAGLLAPVSQPQPTDPMRASCEREDAAAP